MTATTIKAGKVMHAGREFFVSGSCVNHQRHLYLTEREDRAMECTPPGQWVPESECEWIMQRGGDTISLAD